MRVADAVTASAAYPPVLPPFDWTRRFERNGKADTQRVIVTDGGVFENLGVSVMEPGRDPQISAIHYRPDVIIASDAGPGQFTGETLPTSWPKRVTQVVSAVMRKVQDATKMHIWLKPLRKDWQHSSTTDPTPNTHGKRTLTTNVLRALIVSEQERGPDFLRLSNALSALYRRGSPEKRLLDAMLLAVPR